ncbi:MAG: VOC family protein [Candidatus Viridilinea halotolerans]|uniref:VOC family protein n=1 Tax=Candidatus Viridilinea halotolerans TaxID=2491704 RepID=A0A426U017_9CHLR|nr:MAG: VOC family protein [Candidatus Viridilinea halotolerans]
MIQAIDHVVILVADLAAAIHDYEALGFRVMPGGEHTDGATHNALICFADGTYLELLAFRREAPGHRWWPHIAAGEGIIDFALLPQAIAEDVAAAHARGLHLAGPLEGGRVRHDGVHIVWQTAYGRAAELPFLCGDVTPRALRVPAGLAHQHPNGASGIFRLTVAVRDLEVSSARYAALLGRSPLVEPGRRLFKLGASYVVVQSSEPDVVESGTVMEYLELRGQGLAALALRRDRLAAVPRVLDPILTHGVRMLMA